MRRRLISADFGQAALRVMCPVSRETSGRLKPEVSRATIPPSKSRLQIECRRWIVKQWWWQGKPWQAFKTFALLFSFAMNVIVLIAFLVMGPLVLPALKAVVAPIVSGLNRSFDAMGQAHIVHTLDVSDEIPIAFNLPVTAQTNATLTTAVPMSMPATMVLPGGGGQINGTVFLELPGGTQLPVQLNMNVPVSQTVPVTLAVAVDIPLEQTELGQPFSELKGLFTPLEGLLSALPEDSSELYRRLWIPEADAGRPAGAEVSRR
jgi:hypothetical protein